MHSIEVLLLLESCCIQLCKIILCLVSVKVLGWVKGSTTVKSRYKTPECNMFSCNLQLLDYKIFRLDKVVGKIQLSPFLIMNFIKTSAFKRP